MNAAHTRNAAYTRSTAAALVRCPDSVPPKYFSNKNAQHPAECASQQRPGGEAAHTTPALRSPEPLGDEERPQGDRPAAARAGG